MPTLDEHCHPFLPEESLIDRNKDQTISRLHNTDPDDPDSHPPIVMVSQAWLWSNQDFLIAADLGESQIKTDTVNRTFKRVSDVLKNIVQEQQISNILVTVAMLFTCLIENLEYQFDSDSILDLYGRATVNTADDVEQYVKKSGVESMGIKREKSFLHQINDIREELAMIQRVLNQQEEIWGEFASNIWPGIWAKSQEGRKPYFIENTDEKASEEERALMRLVLQPNLLIQKFGRRIQQLDEDAERVERSVITSLDVKAKHASLRESHATAVMSAAVFGFTVITIIFTPLSFVMSLFALPIQSFQDSQIQSRWADDVGMYTTSYIGKWTGKIRSCRNKIDTD